MTIFTPNSLLLGVLTALKNGRLGVGWFGRVLGQFFSFFPKLGVLNASKNGRLGVGWSGRVPGRLVSHFLSFVSQFFSFVVGFPAGLSPTSFHLSPRLGRVGSLLFTCLPVLFICLPGWVLALLFICLAGWVLVVDGASPAHTKFASPACADFCIYLTHLRTQDSPQLRTHRLHSSLNTPCYLRFASPAHTQIES